MCCEAWFLLSIGGQDHGLQWEMIYKKKVKVIYLNHLLACKYFGLWPLGRWVHWKRVWQCGSSHPKRGSSRWWHNFWWWHAYSSAATCQHTRKRKYHQNSKSKIFGENRKKPRITGSNHDTTKCHTQDSNGFVSPNTPLEEVNGCMCLKTTMVSCMTSLANEMRGTSDTRNCGNNSIWWEKFLAQLVWKQPSVMH